MSGTGIRTVMVLELRQRVRATRWRIMLLIWALILTLVCGGLTALILADRQHLGEAASLLYDLIVCFVLGIGLIVAPTLSSTSINGDRADATLALLQATALRPIEIALGKLLAACAAALALLAVALPFLLLLAAVGGATPMALLGHLLVLLVTLTGVCGVGLGLSAVTARTSASTVLTYLVVTALVIGTPLATAISTLAVHDEQQVISYGQDYTHAESSSPEEGNRPLCTRKTHTRKVKSLGVVFFGLGGEGYQGVVWVRVWVSCWSEVWDR